MGRGGAKKKKKKKRQEISNKKTENRVATDQTKANPKNNI